MSNLPPQAKRPDDHILWRVDTGAAKRSGTDSPGEILRLLSRAWRNAALYGASHRVVMGTMNELHEYLREPLSSSPSIRLYIHADTFFLENRVLLEESLRLYSLLGAFKDRQISAIQLDAGVEPWELQHLVQVLNLHAPEVQRLGGADAYLKTYGVQHITVGAAVGAGPGVRAGAEEEAGRPDRKEVKVDPQDAYRAGLRVMDELTYQASANIPLNLGKARVIVNYFIDLINDQSAAMLGIAALKNSDENTYHHSVNVCILALVIGSQLNMDRPLLQQLGLAGLLHDIGKVRVPREIIAKPGTLTSEEEKIVRRHTLYGAHILRELPGPARVAMVVAYEHHANYDLSGYPRITTKDVPYLLTRIVWVADCFDAMTSTRRVYRKPKRPEAALKEILDGAGTLYDPVMAKLFCKYWQTYLERAAGGGGTTGPELAPGGQGD
jgi:putative nucleotidyltransferase with HDIG domain